MIILPLYKEAQTIEPRTCPENANPGLWYNKLCFWDIDRGQWTLDKTEWIKSVTGRKSGQASQLQEWLSRYTTLIRFLGGDVKVYRTISRFVTGLGNEHPVENGFTWHHTLGTPYLPGPSIKGMLRDWVQYWWDTPDQEQPSKMVDEIFGPVTGERRTGNLIVFDAWPVRPVELEIEIMTPHYSQYYQDEGTDKPPADWYSPVPIPYLTVAMDQLFIFGLAPRKNADIDLQQVFQWLDDALGTIGAGAKTASGYGCFQPDNTYKIPVVKQTTRPNIKNDIITPPMSPVRQAMEEDGYSDSNLEKFMQSMTTKWLDLMESSEKASLEIAAYLAEWYRTHKTEDWEKPKPKKKNYDKVMRIKAVLNSHRK